MLHRIHSLLIVLLLVLGLYSQAQATTITISSQTIPNWQYATSAPRLRIYLDRGFITSDGIPLQPTAPGSRFFYKELTCTLLSNTLTIPSFTLDSTTDGQDITTARYSAWFYTSSGAQIVGYSPFDQGFKLPYVIASTSGCSPSGTCATWNDIRLNNVVPAPNLDVTTYTKSQIDAKLVGVSGVPLARTISATSPLRIDGGASADLSSNRTISLLFSTVNFSGDTTTITGGGSTSLGSSATAFSVVPDSTNQRVQILNNGSSVGTRKAINFIPGANINLTVNDNSGSNRIDLTITSTASGSGDVSSNTSSSVDSEVILFSGTTGKTIKRATGTGIVKLTSGVLSVLTDPLPVVNGGTGSSSQNFVDLTNPQSITGVKTLLSPPVLLSSPAADPGQGNTTIASLFKGTDSTSTSPISSSDPSVYLQTIRGATGSTVVGTQSAAQFGYLLNFQSIGRNRNDTYASYTLSRISNDMTGASAGAYYHLAARNYIVLNPSNIGSTQVVGYGLWAQGETVVSGVAAYGAQIDSNNNSGSDAASEDFSSVFKLANIATNYTSNANVSAIIYSQGATNSSAYQGWKISPNSVIRHLLDFKDAFYSLGGTVAVTNGSGSIVGTGTKWLTDLVIGDQYQLVGVPYTVTAIADNTHATISPVYAAATTSGLASAKYVVPLRMAANSFITAENPGGSAEYRFAGLNNNSFWLIDPDSRGTIFGGAFTVNGAITAGNASTVLTDSTGKILSAALNTVTPSVGGTGLTSYTTGDLLYASGSTTLAKLAAVATGSVLVSAGTGAAPAYSTTPSITSLTVSTNLQANDGFAQKIRVGAVATQEIYPGIWFGSAAPDLTNYAFLFDSGLSTVVVNSPGALDFRTQGAPRVGLNNIGIFYEYKGAAVASATTIVPTGNYFHVTGNTNITAIDGTGVVAGTTIEIVFDSNPLLTNGANLQLAGTTNLTPTAGSIVTFKYDGTGVWKEMSRAIR